MRRLRAGIGPRVVADLHELAQAHPELGVAVEQAQALVLGQLVIEAPASTSGSAPARTAATAPSNLLASSSIVTSHPPLLPSGHSVVGSTVVGRFEVRKALPGGC